MDKILDGDDFAHDHDFINYQALLAGFAEKVNRQLQPIERLRRGFGKSPNFYAWDGKTCQHPPVYAYISGGRWLARCWCGNVGYVARKYAYFFCLACGNQPVNGAAVPVIFPENADEIEQELLKRPVQKGPGRPTQAARTAVALILPREWEPGQSIDYLRGLNRVSGV